MIAFRLKLPSNQNQIKQTVKIFLENSRFRFFEENFKDINLCYKTKYLIKQYDEMVEHFIYKNLDLKFYE